MKGLVLGGTASGVGKTVATLATLVALEEAGHDPQPAKAGPDFIDPSHHEAVSGKPSRSLDPWLTGADGLLRTYWRGEGDVCVVEGMMGLYDGSVASTALVADRLDVPVVLVVDASAGMQSVGATALGFQQYADHAGRDVDVVGVIAQRAHGGRHEAGIRDALPTDIAYLGRIPPMADLEIPDRHLGLHMGTERPLDRSTLAEAAQHIDAAALADVGCEPPSPDPIETPGTGHRVAIAMDEAFCFCYPGTVEWARERGGVERFSPLAGDSVPQADAVYLPGGYPELNAEALEASPTLGELEAVAASGRPIYGECGGLMVLSQSLTTAAGDRYEMAGVLPADVEMHDRYQALDHVELRATRPSSVADPGDRRRGHEFHYSSVSLDADATFAFETVRGDGIDGDHDGLVAYNTVGTYSHAHPASGAFDALLSV